VLGRLKLITEPWDVGMGGYQLGNFPPGFAEWNDKYRDTVRSYWKGEPSTRADLAARLSGSADLFDRRSRRPWASVNFLTSHDGFTLADTVAYEERHNEANGEDNRDGHDNNHSRNWGAEGPTDDAGIIETRAKVQRAMLTTLLTSLGTPMLCAGDEFGRTQHGNNNAYCQDNEISWLDWTLLDTEAGADLTRFVGRVAELRRRYAVLHAETFLYGQNSPGHGVNDVEWWDERGQQLSPEDWQNPEGRALSMRRAVQCANGEVEAVNLLLNAGDTPIRFTLPGPYRDRKLLVDSARPDQAEEPIEDEYELAPHAAALICSTYDLGE
jgi:glycogen operon protein